MIFWDTISFAGINYYDRTSRYRRRRARLSSNFAVFRRLLGFKLESTTAIRVLNCIRLPFLLQSDGFGL